MTNYEHYKDEIDKIWNADDIIARTCDGIVRCRGTNCNECLFDNGGKCGTYTQKWLVSKYKDITKIEDVDWSKVPVDTPIFVKDPFSDDWKPGHSAKYENERVYAFSNGRTSFTSSSTNITSWYFANLAKPEDLKPKFQQVNNLTKEELIDKLCEYYENFHPESACKELLEAADKFWNADIDSAKKQKIANMVIELLKLEE